MLCYRYVTPVTAKSRSPALSSPGPVDTHPSYLPTWHFHRCPKAFRTNTGRMQILIPCSLQTLADVVSFPGMSLSTDSTPAPSFQYAHPSFLPQPVKLLWFLKNNSDITASMKSFLIFFPIPLPPEAGKYSHKIEFFFTSSCENYLNMCLLLHWVLWG